MSSFSLSLSCFIVPHPGHPHIHHCPLSLSLIIIVLILTLVTCLAPLLSLVLHRAEPTSMILWSKEDHPLHWKVFKHFIYLYNGYLSHSDVVPGHNHFKVVWFAPICYSDSASSAHIHDFYKVSMHQYVHPLHRNVLKYFIYM